LLVTPEMNQRNRWNATIAAVVLTAVISAFGPWRGYITCLVLGLLLSSGLYWFLRRKCRRRLAVTQRPFSAVWEAILRSRVAFYQGLDEAGKTRFRKLVQIFLAEVQITGVRTDVDETIRILVAASAIIPIFGFQDWEYHRLSEVLVYPASFNQEYQSEGQDERNILGLTGLGHLTGVMILSKPALLSGFSGNSDKENVGIHEFAHVIEQEEASHGLPKEVRPDIVREWVAYVGRELAHPQANQAHINKYGYTNEHEFFAVLTEYFFKSPEVLEQQDPILYKMLREMFHQDPARLMRHVQLPLHLRRNAECPCGSGKKFKDCCQPHLVSSAAGA
jgi:Mlc titration factor MtfA (ptsG expression regulator)